MIEDEIEDGEFIALSPIARDLRNHMYGRIVKVLRETHDTMKIADIPSDNIAAIQLDVCMHLVCIIFARAHVNDEEAIEFLLSHLQAAQTSLAADEASHSTPSA